MKYKSKFGLNSGNTLNFGARSRTLHGVGTARHNNFVTKTLVLAEVDFRSESNFTTADQTDSSIRDVDIDIMPDGDLAFADRRRVGSLLNQTLQYSLDKRKRWLLPAVISASSRQIERDFQSLIDEELQYATSRTRRQRRLHRQQLASLKQDSPPHVQRVSVHRHMEPWLARGSTGDRPGIFRKAGITQAVVSHELFRSDDNTSLINNTSRVSKHLHRKASRSFYARLRLKKFLSRQRGVAAPSTSSSKISRASDSSSLTLAKGVFDCRQIVERCNDRGVQRRVCPMKNRETQKEPEVNGRSVNPSPEIRYDFFNAVPLIAHSVFDDQRHYQRFQWNYLFSGPKKSLKKIGRCRQAIDSSTPATSAELNEFIRYSVDEYLSDCNAPDYTTESDDDECSLDNYSQTSTKTYSVSLLDYLQPGDTSTKTKRKRRNIASQRASELPKEDNFLHRPSHKRQIIYVADDDLSTVYSTTGDRTDCDQKCVSEILKCPTDASNVLQADDDDDLRDFVVVNHQSCASGLNIDDVMSWKQVELEASEFSCSVSNRPTVDSLSRALRGNYDEGRSLPRRFLIDLTRSHTGSSDNVEKTSSRQIRKSRFKRRVYLIAEEGKANVDKDQAVDSEPQETSHRLRCQLVGDEVTAVGQVLRSSFENITVNNIDVIVEAAKQLAQMDSETLGSLVTSDGCCVSSDCPASEQRQIICDAKDVVTSVECGICYEPMNTTSEVKVNGVSLMECRHWFCIECWRKHLITSIIETKTELFCPGHECSSVVDLVTAVSLLPLKLIDRFVQYKRRHSGRWLSYSTLRQRRVPILTAMGSDADDSMELQNSVGVVQTTVSEAIQTRNPEHVRQVFPMKVSFVKAKLCPQCRVLIEKNNGCNHMVCTRCNTEFCWLCVRRYPDPCRCGCGRNVNHRMRSLAIVPTNKGDILNYMEPVSYLSVDDRWKKVSTSDTTLMNRLSSDIEMQQRRMKTHWPDWLQTAGTEWLSYLFFTLMDNSAPGVKSSTSDVDNLVNTAITFYFDAKFVLELQCKSHKEQRNQWLCRQSQYALHMILTKVEQLLFKPKPAVSDDRLVFNLYSCLENGLRYLSPLAKMVSEIN